ncbi:MAG: hypothetical protein RSB51_03970 [Clostridia bacterium]
MNFFIIFIFYFVGLFLSIFLTNILISINFALPYTNYLYKNNNIAVDNKDIIIYNIKKNIFLNIILLVVSLIVAYLINYNILIGLCIGLLQSILIGRNQYTENENNISDYNTAYNAYLSNTNTENVDILDLDEKIKNILSKLITEKTESIVEYHNALFNLAQTTSDSKILIEESKKLTLILYNDISQHCFEKVNSFISNTNIIDYKARWYCIISNIEDSSVIELSTTYTGLYYAFTGTMPNEEQINSILIIQRKIISDIKNEAVL